MLDIAARGHTASSLVPLSIYQRDICIAAMQFPELDQYTLFGYDRFSGHVDEIMLAEAMSLVAQRTDALRLRVREEQGALYQWDARDAAPTAHVVDFTSEVDPDVAVQSWLREAFRFSYALDGGKLADLYLLRTNDAVIAYVRAHHIVCDAWGLRLFLEEVRAEYLRLTGVKHDSPSMAPSYLELVAGDEYLSSLQHRADQDYFAAELGGVEPALFTRRRPSGARATARHAFYLERALLEQIRDQGHSPFLLLSAAVALYLDASIVSRRSWSAFR